MMQQPDLYGGTSTWGRINKEVEKVDLTSTVWEVDSLLEVNAVYIVEVNSDKCQLLRQSTL